MQLNVRSQMANFDLFLYDVRRIQETSVCLDFLFEILSIFNSNFIPESRHPDVFVIFLFLHRLINAWVSSRNRLEFIVRKNSIIPQANSNIAVTKTSLLRLETTKKLISWDANGHRYSRHFPNLKEADISLRLTLSRFLLSDNAWQWKILSMFRRNSFLHRQHLS
jgi:hypothetical protein